MLSGIILSAGESSRMLGRAKALLEISKIVVSEYKSQLPQTIEKLIILAIIVNAI